MRKVTITFQGMAFTFSVHSRGKHTNRLGNTTNWVKIVVTRDGESVDYCYAKNGVTMREAGNKWLQGAS